MVRQWLYLGSALVLVMYLELGYCTVTFVSGNTPDDTGACGSVAENTPPGTLSITLQATFSTGTAAASSNPYTIETQDVAGQFVIAGTGFDELHLATGKTLDFETKASYTLTIKATDDTSPTALTATSVCTVTITDVNEAPDFATMAYNFQTNSGSGAGTVIGTVTATDPDTTAANNVITYSITGGDTGSVFAISGTTGQITVATGKTVNAGTSVAYILEITATSSGTGTLTDTKEVRIAVAACSSAGKAGGSLILMAMLGLVVGAFF